MKLPNELFDLLNTSQDGKPLATYARRRAETMVGELELPIGDCVSETIFRCFEEASDADELLANLRYATAQLSDATRAVMWRPKGERDA